MISYYYDDNLINTHIFFNYVHVQVGNHNINNIIGTLQHLPVKTCQGLC